MEKAYKNFFAKRAEFPRFKKKGQGGSFRYPDAKQFKLDQSNSRIFLPKLEWMRYRNCREVLGIPKTVSMSASGKWLVSIQTAREIEQPIHSSTSAVDIGMGVVRFATLSDGTVRYPIPFAEPMAPMVSESSPETEVLQSLPNDAIVSPLAALSPGSHHLRRGLARHL